MTQKQTTIAASLIFAVGLFHMAGDLLHLPALKGLGAATMISPAPKVFTAQRGLETYSAKFMIKFVDAAGKDASIEITPELYARVLGPYWRRNVYGAVLSYGPVLATDPSGKPMFDAISHYALSTNAPLLRELGANPDERTPITVVIVPPDDVSMGNLPRELEIKR
jgi:hypothetical protein